MMVDMVVVMAGDLFFILFIIVGCSAVQRAPLSGKGGCYHHHHHHHHEADYPSHLSCVNQVPRTLDNTREVDVTIVQPDDEEVFQDEAEDEFQPYFMGEKQAKIFITTRPRPSRELFRFIGDLMQLIPNSFFYPRKSYTVKDLCRMAGNKGFTHIFVLSEKSKVRGWWWWWCR